MQPDPLAGHETYATVGTLSSGTYGTVLLARERHSGAHFALKFIPRGTIATNYVRREIINHMKLRHPHVIALLEVFLTQTHLVIVMEYARGGDLFRYVQKQRGLPETEARWFFRQIIAALDYCHRMGVCLRDIKLENTLLTENPQTARTKPLVKLCDFGFSKHAETDSAPGSKVGTPAYLAPEVIAAPSSSGGQSTYDGPAADVWSLGVLLYVMCCGAYPFRSSDDDALPSARRLDAQFRRIMAVDYRFPDSISLSPSFRDLVRKLLVREPAKRATLREVMDHEWFKEGYSLEHWQRVMESNDEMVEFSQSNPLPADLQEEIRGLVEDAGRSHRAATAAAAAAAANAGNSGEGVTQQQQCAEELDGYQDHVDAMLEGGTMEVDNDAMATAELLEQI